MEQANGAKGFKMSEAELSANDLTPVIKIQGVPLHPFMSRVDLLVPILMIDGEMENLLLDLHYSINKKFTRFSKQVVPIIANIASLIVNQKIRIIDDLKERAPMWLGEEVLNAWMVGFDTILKCAQANTEISWVRAIA